MERQADAELRRAPRERKTPEKVTSTTKVNVAFPFSQVKIQEPSQQLIRLAERVKDLADFVAEKHPDGEGQWLVRRAEQLVDELR